MLAPTIAAVFGDYHFLNDRAAKNTGRRGGHWPSAGENSLPLSPVGLTQKRYIPISNRIAPPARSGRAMLGLGRRPIRVENGIFAIAVSRLFSAVVFGDYHCLNDRAAKITGRRGGHWPSVCENSLPLLPVGLTQKRYIPISNRIAPPARSGRAMLAPTGAGLLLRTRVQKRQFPLSPVGLTQKRLFEAKNRKENHSKSGEMEISS